jgi:hypothetical protein
MTYCNPVANDKTIYDFVGIFDRGFPKIQILKRHFAALRVFLQSNGR